MTFQSGSQRVRSRPVGRRTSRCGRRSATWRRLRVRELPRRAEREPRVGQLDLTPVDEGLPEDAVLVPDAVADARHVHGGERVDETGGQAAEAAVAEARLDLLSAHGGDVDAALLERVLGHVHEVGGQQVVAELAAEQVLRGEVAHHLGGGGPAPGTGLQPGGHQVATDGLGEREVLVVDGGARQHHALPEVELGQELLDEPVDRWPEAARPGPPPARAWPSASRASRRPAREGRRPGSRLSWSWGSRTRG